MAPVETEYYDLVWSLPSRCRSPIDIPMNSAQLGVGTDVQDTDLKKAYRKQAMKVC